MAFSGVPITRLVKRDAWHAKVGTRLAINGVHSDAIDASYECEGQANAQRQFAESIRGFCVPRSRIK
jgi:hypothetical protein